VTVSERHRFIQLLLQVMMGTLIPPLTRSVWFFLS
jgi:hypothetical protein